MITATHGNKEVTRNSSFFKHIKLADSILDKEEDEEYDDDDTLVISSSQQQENLNHELPDAYVRDADERRRYNPIRNRCAPKKLNDFVCYYNRLTCN